MRLTRPGAAVTRISPPHPNASVRSARGSACTRSRYHGAGFGWPQAVAALVPPPVFAGGIFCSRAKCAARRQCLKSALITAASSQRPGEIWDNLTGGLPMKTTRLSTKGQIVLPKGLRVSRECARPSQGNRVVQAGPFPPGSQNRPPSADGSVPILRRLRGPVSLAGGGAAHERSTKFAPALLIQLYFVFLRSGFDAFPGGVAFRVGHPLHLLEAGDCVAHVSSVMDGFFTFLGKSEIFIGNMIAASFSDFGHAS